jgi:glutamate/tyrosine decarboxylase-like PLP-dependent enzyme
MKKEKQMLSDVFSLISKYIEENEDEKTLVIKNKTPKDLRDEIDFGIKKEGVSEEELVNLADKYLKYSVRTGHSQFANQLFQGFTYPGVIGEILTATTNTSMYTYEVAPVATLIEIELISKMNCYLGFKNGEGTFVPGGSYSNMIAVLSARNKFRPDIKKKGIQNNDLVMFISDQAHYSFRKAANMLGIGVENIINIPSDKDGRMIPDKLEKEIEKVISEGRLPFFVGATAGTTVTGSFDPITKISELSRKYKLWLHVDGALGASAILSKKYKHLVEGIDRADSVTWNPHKMMGIPLSCSVILIKERGLLENACSVDHGSYLFHHSEESYDLGQKSLQCGRRVDSLKLWLAWKYFGEEGYDARITKLFELANYAQTKIQEKEELELLFPLQSLNLCFRFKESSNEINLRIHNQLLKSGKSMVNYAKIEGKISFRLALINPDIDEKDIDTFFENVYEAKETICGNANG